MELIGHRGCGTQSKYPENTVRAVTEAADHLPAIEIDVRRCGSGELVIHHDEEIEQADGEKAVIAETDYKTLEQVELGPLGDTIPTLSDIINSIPSSVTLQIEMKEMGIAQDIFKIASKAQNQIRVSSFSEKALEEFASIESDIPTGYLFRDEYKRSIEMALDLNCDIVHPHYELCTRTDVVHHARERGLRVIAWNTNDPSVVAAVSKENVDGITVDRWDLKRAKST